MRGIDLIDSTPRQVWLQRLLGYATPGYMHIPVITHADGHKLSKATGAPAIPLDTVRTTLVAALDALRQHPPADLAEYCREDIWGWAVRHWQPDTLSGLEAIIVESP